MASSGANPYVRPLMASADKPELPDLAGLPEGDATPERTPEAPKKGVDVIRDELTRLPNKPGVYRMVGAEGEVLYVGKAKSLKARVSNYAAGRGHGNHIARMISQTRAMEFIVTATETEALLLETNMIKRLRPRFNVLMRDDKSFPYIAIRRDHPIAALQKHRGAKNFKGDYFGPFASAGAVNRTLNTLQKAFLLRSCTDSTYGARTRPCMLYQIKRCSAPCTGEIGEEEYARLVVDSVDFLKGRSVELQDRLAAQMHDASEALEFEQAARLRNRIRALASVRAVQGVNVSTFAEADVFALHCEGGQSCIQVFFFRAGQNWGNRAYFPKHEKDLDPADILDAFLAQFYDDKEPPSLVLVSHEPPGRALLEEAFALKADRKVEIRRPERGEKREIMDQAVLNAREALGRRMAESASVARLLEGVGDVFGLPRAPERIEVYDNSHIQGTNAVGAMIVAGPEGFRKNQYRKFNMKEITPGDDFAMMQAMIRRRFARLMKDSEHPSPPSEGEGGAQCAPGEGAARNEAHSAPLSPHPAAAQPPSPASGRGLENGGVDFSKLEDEKAEWPDLLLIDGGEGQLDAAMTALKELGVADQVCVVGVAKGVDRDAGRERFFMPGKAPFRLDEKSPVLYYLQRLRDEAHRFAIGAHRQKRAADIGKNPLDEIDGVGPSRKKALLARFGSARGVSRAALAELEGVEGINTELARRIHDFFRNKP
jgi:excinuclease ABC subunit C